MSRQALHLNDSAGEELSTDDLSTEAKIERRFIGANIKARRKLLGMEQKEVAAYLDMPENTYSQWESGRNTMPVSAVRGLAKCLKCPVSTFFGDQTDIDNFFVREQAILALLNTHRDSL